MTKKDYLSSLKVGDKVVRLLAGTIPMNQIVWKIENNIIYTENHIIKGESGWRFNATTGGEIDEALEWDGEKKTGSILQMPEQEGDLKVDDITEVMGDKLKKLVKDTGKGVGDLIDEAKKMFKNE